MVVRIQGLIRGTQRKPQTTLAIISTLDRTVSAATRQKQRHAEPSYSGPIVINRSLKPLFQNGNLPSNSMRAPK